MPYHQLTHDERYQISFLKKQGLSLRAIAHELNRSASTISRELRRNLSGDHRYYPRTAHTKSDQRRRQAKKYSKLTETVKGWVDQLLRQDLSPDQVCGYLKREKGICLHHETVYRHIYKDLAQGGSLFDCLRWANKVYRKRRNGYDRRGRIPNRVDIELRPKVVEGKSRIGDWEGDLIVDRSNKHVLLTLVERKSLFTVITKQINKQAATTAETIIEALRPFAGQVKTLTLDNGMEFAHHEKVTEKLGIKIYFSKAYASWQRGINENTNGLIRRYFPKSTLFREVSEQQVAEVQQRLNQRPRKTRGYKTPEEIFLKKTTCLLQ